MCRRGIHFFPAGPFSRAARRADSDARFQALSVSREAGHRSSTALLLMLADKPCASVQSPPFYFS